MDAARMGFLTLTAILAASGARALTDAELLAVRDGFERRRDEAMASLRGQPYRPEAKREPLGPGRALYTRHFSYAALSFAFRAMWNDEQFEAANAALDENSEYYLTHPQAFADRDSFYWGADILCRIVEFFGRHGSRAPGRLSSHTEDLILAMMFAYAKDYSKLDDAESAQSRTWHVWESENHHIQKFSALWQFSKLLSRETAWRDQSYADGRTPAEHYTAWTAYAKEYCRERARRGLFIEMANGGYGVHTLKGVYNFLDFADDPQLATLASMLLDLYWATWAEEQLGGIRGGGKSRIYPANAVRGKDELYYFSRYYLGEQDLLPPSNHFFTILSSRYRLPLVVMDLALDPAGRGVYEIRQRRLGLALPGYNANPDYRLDVEHGGIVRYSYCTPDFILGLPLLHALPNSAWTLISSQNRWQGVVFAGDAECRIVPLCQAKDGRTAYNQMWGVQAKGAMLCQRLADTAVVNTGGMRVYFSPAGLSHRVEEQGWVCCEAPQAYAAVRPARGGYRWGDGPDAAWMIFDDGRAPAILEVARKQDYPSYEAFIAAVVTQQVRWSGPTLTYHSLAGDVLSLPTDYDALPAVNGRPIDLAPDQTFDSPFIQSGWGSGRVTITKGSRTLTLDFDA